MRFCIELIICSSANTSIHEWQHVLMQTFSGALVSGWGAPEGMGWHCDDHTQSANYGIPHTLYRLKVQYCIIIMVCY